MTEGLDNVFVKGTQALPLAGDIERSAFPFPVNRDWTFFGQVMSYDETSHMVVINAVWDTATVKTTFHAQAMYLGKSGTPKPTEVITGSYCLVSRTGKGNNGPSGVPAGFQLDDDTTNTASFVAFFFTF